MAKTYCPNCDGMINVGNPRLGATLTCSGCDVELEVINVNPFEIDFVSDEDWDYDEDWEWEDDEATYEDEEDDQYDEY
jgi:lysine biosynthesis protein LysW